MGSKHFLLHLILTLSWCLKNKIRPRWEKFASSYNPFFHIVLITILATAKIARNTSHLETEAKCPQCNQHWAAWAAWVWCKPSPLWHDPKMNELAHSSWRRAQPFLLRYYRSKDNRACLPGMLCNSSQKGQCIPCKPPGEQEIRIVQEARTWHPIQMQTNLLHWPAEPIYEGIRSWAHH